MHEQALLEVRDVSRRFGATFALRGVSFSLQAGDVLAVFGPNGAGKSTLLRIVAGLLRADRGEVRFAGEPFERGNPQQRRRVGLISHASLCYDGLTAIENLVFYARLYGLSDPPARARAALASVQLEDRADTMTSAMSRGMVQRLSIARALLHDPAIVLLDEPFTGLDQRSAEALTAELATLRGAGRVLVVVSHHAAEVRDLATHVAVLEAGRLADYHAA